MKPKQKRIVALLVAANVVLVLGLVLWIFQALNANPSSTRQSEGVAGASTPDDAELTVVPLLPTTPSHEACQWKAAQLLAHARLNGAVTLTPAGVLRFDIVYSLAPGQVADEAAQSIWLAFDIALDLVEEECNLFTQVEVIVLAQGNATSTRISARVSTADLVAFDAGELSEDQFAARVTYHVGDE
jgi:hypothetical protein